ncbi:M48 family metalloprotease [Solemya velum gill symbiont]|uniref:M48 family metalloprotease n=1 Tax=Solemya velum gill symbiont TaxID=2340 RepID=UPI0015C3B227|nr:M48 family metalloprotease [Solemya velum gill symbiont]
MIKPLLTILLFSWTLHPALALDYSLPDMGESSGAYLSTVQERKLGRAFMRYVHANTNVVKDTMLTGYLQSLGDRLASKAQLGAGSFNFFLVDDMLINAFAGPGGYIGVHTGLILEAETEDELAAVVAHEIAHVSQRHIARMVQEAEQMAMPAAGMLLAAILLGAATGGAGAMAMAAGGQAALMQKQINFTRANEREADNIGIQILAKSKHDTRAMATFFQRLGRATNSGGVTLPEFLLSHPVTADRTADALARARARAEKYPYQQQHDDFDFQLFRAAIRADQFSSGKSSAKHFKSTLRDGRYRSEDAERYGLVLGLMRSRKYSEARKELGKLLSKHPRNPMIRATNARLWLKQGNNQKAVSTAKQALASKPGNHALTVLTADIMTRARQPKSAYKLLKKHAKSHSDDPQTFKLLARAAAGSKKKADSHAALADYHFLVGEPDVAVQQLLIALKTPGLSFYSKSKLEAKKRMMEEESAALKR